MQIRNWIIRGTAITALALMGGVASQTAEARTVPGSNGLTIPQDRHCFYPFAGDMYNGYCGHIVSLDIPLVVDNGGNHNITVTAQGASPNNNVGCRGEGTDQSISVVWYSNGGAYSYLPNFGSAVDIPLNNVNVPGWGSLLVNCQVYAEGHVYTVNWNP